MKFNDLCDSTGGAVQKVNKYIYTKINLMCIFAINY